MRLASAACRHTQHGDPAISMMSSACLRLQFAWCIHLHNVQPHLAATEALKLLISFHVHPHCTVPIEGHNLPRSGLLLPNAAWCCLLLLTAA